MTHTVAALFGAMIALLVYTRLGGTATVLLALAVLIVYICVEVIRTVRDESRSRRDAAIAYDRLRALDMDDFMRRSAKSRATLQQIADDAFANAAEMRRMARRARR